jgi:hypothetical protein
MPRHQRVTTCRRTGGPLSEMCECEHCNLSVCSVCGAYEGGLTTDCPGSPVDFARQREVHETPLDYTDRRGWHQATSLDRVPCFETTRRRPAPLQGDPRTILAPATNWPMIDRYASLQQELARKAIAWVLADRTCDDLSAALTQAQDMISALGDTTSAAEPDDEKRLLLARLTGARVNFQHACRVVEERDDEFRQIARRLADTLEEQTSAVPPG